DGTGQRVQTTQAGVTKSYFYDINGSVVAEYEATGGTGYGALKRLNVCAGGRLLAVDEVQTNGTKLTSYVMADRQGSTRVLMDAAGAVTSRHDYLPYGEELGAGTGMRATGQGYSAADSVRQRYAETRMDDATGLDHTLWRKLETRSGRWTTPDPYGRSLRVANPQSFNRYSFVLNDPVNRVDRSGLDDEPLDPWDPADVITTNTWDERPYGGVRLDRSIAPAETSNEANVDPVLIPQNPVLTGFKLGANANFDYAKTVILKQVNDRIKSKDCADYLNKLLGDNHVAGERNTLDKLLNIATLGMYDSEAGGSTRSERASAHSSSRFFQQSRRSCRSHRRSRFLFRPGISTILHRCAAKKLSRKLECRYGNYRCS
ncbi:MAG: RHS repeat domain-containing protein, partial [Acidobacteriota bacterium]